MIIYSRGAHGSDLHWERAAKLLSNIETRHVYIKGFKTPYGNWPIELGTNTRSNFDRILSSISSQSGRKYPTNTTYVNNLLRRNLYISGICDQLFAIGAFEHSPYTTVPRLKGGTMWATEHARRVGKVVNVFDQNINQWFVWGAGKWEECNPPSIIHETISCIGTRELNKEGMKAIRQLFLQYNEEKLEE